MKAMGLILMGLMILIGGCDNIAPELLPALPGAPVFVADRPYVRAYLVSPKSREFFASELEDIIFDIDSQLRKAQEFFASEMDRHGHGRMTFPIALDAAGHVHVTHLTLPEKSQFYLDGTVEELTADVYEAYHAREPASGETPLFFVDDIPWSAWKGFGYCGQSGFVTFVLIGCGGWKTVAHELGHRFGLPHDWRNGEYVMSYGGTLEPDGTLTPVAYPDANSKLSRGAAAWLSHNPTFNGRRVTQFEYDCFLFDLERDIAPVEGNTEGLHQFHIRFRVPCLSHAGGSRHTPQFFYEIGAFVIARVIERTAFDVTNHRSGNVVRYLDKDDLQFTLQAGDIWNDDPWLHDDSLQYDLRFTAHLRVDTEVVYLDLLGDKTFDILPQTITLVSPDLNAN